MKAFIKKLEKRSPCKMDPSILSQHVQFVVPLEKLTQAEYSFNHPIDFTKTVLKSDSDFRNLKISVNALLNSSGGVINVEDKTVVVTDKSFDQWIQNAEDQLKLFIPKNIYQSCISVYSTTPVRIRVQPTASLVTLRTNTYARSQAQTSMVECDNECLIRIMNRNGALPVNRAATHVKKFLNGKTLHVGEPLGVREGATIEMKCFDSPDVVKRFQEELKRVRIVKTMFAMLNQPEGGVMIFGAKEDTGTGMNTIEGLKIDEEGIRRLEKCLGEFFSKYPLQNLQTTTRLKPAVNWDVSFYSISDQDDMYLMMIELFHYQGGFFHQAPESYYTSEDGNVHKMEFTDWKKRLVRNGQRLQLDSPQSLRGIPSSEILYSSGDAASDKVQKVSPGGPPSPSYIPPPEALIDLSLKGIDALSWTRNTLDWRQHLQTGPHNKATSLSQLVSSPELMAFENPINFTPNADLISNVHTNMNDALQKVQRDFHEQKAFGIAAKSWMKMFHHSIEPSVPHSVLLDLLMVDETNHLILYSFVCESSSENLEELWAYIMLTGRLIKRKLVESMLLMRENCDIEVQCRLFNLHIQDLINPSWVDEEKCALSISKCQNSTEDHQKVHLKALGSLLLSKNTLIKNIYGEQSQIVLSSKQIQTVLSSPVSQVTYIEGPPGSGKTFLGIYLCKNYGQDSLYICMSPGLKAFIEYQDIPAALVRSPEDLQRLISEESFENKRLVIWDDSHNCSQKDCNNLAKMMIKDIVEVYGLQLIIFADNRFQDYRFNKGKSSFRQILGEICETDEPDTMFLKDIHRNSRKVTSFIITSVETQSSKSSRSIRSLHPSDGDDVEVAKLANIRIKGDSNGLVKYTKELTSPIRVLAHDPLAYQLCDIAILSDSKLLVNLIRDIFISAGISVQTACDYPRRHLVIDTLDNFVGLDARAVLIVRSDETALSTDFANPRYRAFTASRGINRVVYIVEKPISAKTAGYFKFDKLPHKNPVLRKLWEKKIRNRSGDACLFNGDVVAILFTGNSELKMISLAGDQIPVPFDPVEPMRYMSSLGNVFAGIHFSLDFENGPWYWSVYSFHGSKRKKIGTYEVDIYPRSIDITEDGEIVMLGKKPGAMNVLRKYRQDGSLVWERGNLKTKLVSPLHLATGPGGQIYVSDFARHHVSIFSSDGDLVRSVPDDPTSTDIILPLALCVDDTGCKVIIGHGERDSETVSVLDMDSGNVLPILLTHDTVYSLTLHDNKYLAIATPSGLFLYDISEFL